MSNSATWIGALEDAAAKQQIILPLFQSGGMGALRSATTESGRFITIKRRIVPAELADTSATQWTLWFLENNDAVPIASFRESAQPTSERVELVLSFLKGWLIDGWTRAETQAAVSGHPQAQTIRVPPATSTECSRN